jgi:hypothetical protein
MTMADGSQTFEPKKSTRTTVEKRYVVVPTPPKEPDIFPCGTQQRINTVAMALAGAVKVFEEICDGSEAHCGVSGILTLAVQELNRINWDFEEFEPRAVAESMASA